MWRNILKSIKLIIFLVCGIFLACNMDIEDSNTSGDNGSSVNGTDEGIARTVQIVATNIGTDAETDLAIDKAGNIIVIWSGNNGTGSSIYASRYTINSGVWSGVQEVENLTLDALSPSIGIDQDGNAIAVWLQYNGTSKGVYFNRYDVSTNSWGSPQALDSEESSPPKVIFDTFNNAFVIWQKGQGIYTTYYNKENKSWSVAQCISIGYTAARDPHISINNSGDAIAVWVGYNDSLGYALYANHYSKNINIWGSPIKIGTSNIPYYPQVAFDPNGNAIAVWCHCSTDGNCSTYVNRYITSSGWESPRLIGEKYVGSPYKPQISIDKVGNAMIAWSQHYNGRYHIYANKFSLNSDWGSLFRIKKDLLYKQIPRVAYDSKGNAIVVWCENYKIYASLYNSINNAWCTSKLVHIVNSYIKDFKLVIDPNDNVILLWADGTNICVCRFLCSSLLN